MRSLIVDTVGRYVLCLAMVLTLSVQAQVASPGNVDHPVLWLHPTTTGDTASFRLHTSSGSISPESGAGPLSGDIVGMNTHAIPNLTYSTAHWYISDSAAPAGTTLFLIERPSDAEEHTLWSLDVADTGRLVLTTHRAADLRAGKHLMNDPASSGPVKLIAHHHRAKTRNEGPAYFRLGHTAPVPAVPTPVFEGTIPEVLFYGRVLSPKEQSRVSSYLAIKYGISLSGADYVASDQRRVWSINTNAAFAHNVVAIAHDSASVLDQRQSTSSNEEGFLTLAHDTIVRWHHEHPAQLPDGHYLVAGDDGEPRHWAERRPGQPQFSARTWHLQRTGPMNIASRLRLSTDMMGNAPEHAETYWLFVDRPGTGEFGPASTEIIKATRLEPGKAEFQVIWDTDGSGSDRFRFAAGGPFVAMSWVEQPTCDPPTMGALTIRVPGAEAPATCRLKGIGLDVDMTVTLSTDTSTTIAALQPGEYEVTIQDNSGYTLTDRIWIQPKDAPVIDLRPQYELLAEEPLVLDATVAGSFVAYEWSYEDQLVGREHLLTISKPGYYTCTAVADGCPTRATTRVSTRVPDGGIALGVMPNPSLDGDLAIQVSLPATVDATLTVATMQGTLVRQRILRGQDFHRLLEHLDGPGEYIISVRTADGQRYTRVIIL